MERAAGLRKARTAISDCGLKDKTAGTETAEDEFEDEDDCQGRKHGFFETQDKPVVEDGGERGAIPQP